MSSAFVINLRRRPDRLARFKQRFARVGLTIAPFVAVDADDLPDPSETDLVPKGILACWRSHATLLAEIAEGANQLALVLEDDAVPDTSVDWPLLLQRLPDAMESADLGFLQLGFVSWQFGLTRPGTLERIRRLLYASETATIDLDRARRVILGSALSGTHAYVVSREFAKRIEGVNDPCWTGADGLFMRLSSMSGADGRFPRMARLMRSLVEQESRTRRSRLLDSDVS